MTKTLIYFKDLFEKFPAKRLGIPDELKDNKILYQKKILLPPVTFSPYSWHKSKSRLLDFSTYFTTSNYWRGYFWVKLTWSHWYVTTSSLEGVHSITDSCRIHTNCSNSDTCKSHSSLFHTENSTFSVSTCALSSAPTPVLSQGSQALHQVMLLKWFREFSWCLLPHVPSPEPGSKSALAGVKTPGFSLTDSQFNANTHS